MRDRLLLLGVVCLGVAFALSLKYSTATDVTLPYQPGAYQGWLMTQELTECPEVGKGYLRYDPERKVFRCGALQEASMVLGRVPDMTLVALEGGRLVVAGTFDPRCHPQGGTGTVGAVVAMTTEE